MLEVNDCSWNRVVTYPDGIILDAEPFKAETEEWLVNWVKSLPPHPYDIPFDEWYTNHIKSGAYKKCHDCGVTDGNYHHPGCDVERCPRCRGQLISCGCLDKEDE